MMDFQHIIETVGRYMDFAGVAVMVIGALVSIPMALRGYRPKRLPADAERLSVYRSYRQLLGAPFCWDWSCLWRPTSSEPSRHADVRKRGRAGDHRAHPYLPELLAGAGDHGLVALAEGADGG